MAAITKNVFSNQFSISFPIMSCYLLKVTKKYSTPIWSRVSRVVSSALGLLEFGDTRLLDFCDAAALVLSRPTVFYLLKQVALSFVGTSCRMITACTTVSVPGGIIRS